MRVRAGSCEGWVNSAGVVHRTVWVKSANVNSTSERSANTSTDVQASRVPRNTPAGRNSVLRVDVWDCKRPKQDDSNLKSQTGQNECMHFKYSPVAPILDLTLLIMRCAAAGPSCWQE